MPLYRYKVVSTAGEVSAGTMRAEGRQQVVAHFQALGHIPMQAEEVRDSWLGGLLTRDSRADGRRSSRIVAVIIRQLETLLRAGIPVDRALEILHGQAASKTEAEALRRLLQKVRSGSALADAMAGDPLFPGFCTCIVRAGEAGGALESTLGNLAGQLERALKAKEKFQSAMIYPVIVGLACLLSFAFLFAFVVPRFQAFFINSDVPVPAMTQAVLWIGQALDQYGWALLAGLGIIVLLVIRHLRDPARRRRWSGRLLRVPLLGALIVKAEVGQFCRVLGTLLKNGVPLAPALDIVGGTFRNPVLADAVANATVNVKEGQGLADSLLPTGAFPRLALRLLRVGEEAARLDDMLLEIAEVYDRETERDIERMISLLGPALTIGFGLLVALVIGSILVALLGVYQLTM